MRNVSYLPVIRLFLGLAVVFFFASCQSATPASRIEANPAIFQALPKNQQELVKKGSICEGMSPDAVFLAWGAPDTPAYEGQKNGKKITRWLYNTMVPIVVDNGWNAPYRGPLGWYDPYYMGPSTAFLPRNAASVLFENGKVVSWERRGAAR